MLESLLLSLESLPNAPRWITILCSSPLTLNIKVSKYYPPTVKSESPKQMLKGQSAVAEEIHFNYRSIVSPFRSCSKDLSFGNFYVLPFKRWQAWIQCCFYLFFCHKVLIIVKLYFSSWLSNLIFQSGFIFKRSKLLPEGLFAKLTRVWQLYVKSDKV